MSMSVSVLCPGGRRQVIKVTPNMSIMQILEDVCSKQKLDAKQFNLMHYNRTLDLSTSVRFANLPNRAQLELAASEYSRVDGDVTLATQLPDGSRIVKVFSCNVTLWEVLEEQAVLPSIDQSLVPVCIYTRREVAGEAALKTTTLRTLGLTGGKAIIRFAPRPVGRLPGSQAHVSAPLAKPTPPEPSLDQPAPDLPVLDQSAVTPSVDSQSAPAKPAVDESQLPTAPISQSKPSAVVKSETDITCGDVTLAEYDVTMAVSDPLLSLSAPQAAAAGESSKSSEAMDYTPATSTTNSAISGNSAISEISGDTFLIDGASLGSSDSAESQLSGRETQEERIVYLGDRQAVAFSLDVIGAPPQLPDDFYDVTEDDVRKRLRQLRQDVAALAEGGPLLTAQQREAQRQADMLSSIASHRNCIIRAQFPDRLVLQAVFLSTELVSAVCEFLATHLSDPSAQFSLYTTPPRTPLPRHSRLFEAGCVPAALVHVSATSGASVALSRDVRAKLSSPAGAARALSRARVGRSCSSSGGSTAGGASPSHSVPGADVSAQARARASLPTASASARASLPTASASTSSAARHGERPGVPKWFKMSK